MMTPTTTNRPATFDDLMQAEGKAELMNGRIVQFMSTGLTPHRIGKQTFRSLDRFAVMTGVGEAFNDNLGYKIDPPLPSGRQSFNPDVSYHAGPLPQQLMGFVDGPPTFAVEIRSEHDYGPAKDRAYADKRRDYFFAGTLAVWDVDSVGQIVTLYRAADPLTPVVFRRGEIADAEPAVPGWRLPVDDLFA